jgi:tRNA A37 threonylcarbamoyladenosine synthetase subunit TsaC/SUA5/YrdC
LRHAQRLQIGIRIPDHPVPHLLLLAELGEPIMSSTLLLPGETAPLTNGREIRARLEHRLMPPRLWGIVARSRPTVVDLAVSPPVIRRQGRGHLPDSWSVEPETAGRPAV